MALFHTTVLDEQIKALPTVGEASGSIATFDTDMTENLIEVVCDIQYSQAEGTPSPDNQLPITTFSEMNVIHKGKNLIDDSLYYQAGANTVVIGQTLPNSNRTIFLKAGTYTIKVNTNVTAGIYYDFGNGSTFIGNTTDAQNFTLTNDSWCSFSLYKGGGFSPSDYSSIQLEFGNYATDYQAFNGNTYNIPFGQTVAQGLLNVTTGVLEITHGAVDMGNLQWTYRSDATAFYSDLAPNCVINPITCACSCYEFNASANDTNVIRIAANLSDLQIGAFSNEANKGRFVVKDLSFTDATAFTTAVTGQKIVYPINQTTIQLSATQITALLNENNIWCDTGDTSVKYILSVGKAIS